MVKYGIIKPQKKITESGEKMEQNIKILLADENPDFRRSCRSNLIGMGFKRIEEASDGEDCLYKIEKYRPDVVVCDVWLKLSDARAGYPGNLQAGLSMAETGRTVYF